MVRAGASAREAFHFGFFAGIGAWLAFTACSVIAFGLFWMLFLAMVAIAAKRAMPLQIKPSAAPPAARALTD